MDKTTKILLGVIAAALSAIAFKMYFPGASKAPTYGDFAALRAIEDKNERIERRKALFGRIPLVWVEGGQIDAEVSGSVAIEN